MAKGGGGTVVMDLVGYVSSNDGREEESGMEEVTG
jgi:hypothetical protein